MITKPRISPHEKGMTLIETLVAVTILAVAIVAPMTLTMQSLAAAYYARDSIIASHLAQEGVESVRAARDGNILRIALNVANPNCETTTLLCDIPIGEDFMIDARNNEMTTCDADGTSECDPLQSNGDLYGYQTGWEDTTFTRTIFAEYVDAGVDEIRVTVTISWPTRTGTRTFPISENLYRWVDDGSGI